MDTKKVRAMLTIVQKGSLTAASEELGYTQPGLTNMMRSLEDEVGVPLLIRGKTGARLSPAGTELFSDFKELMEVADRIMNTAETIKVKNQSQFHVGAIASVARNWLPDILSEFKLSFPETSIYVTRHDVLKSTYEAVRTGELDCALVSYQDEYAADLVWYPMYKDELVAVLPLDYPVRSNTFAADDFYYTDFLMPAGGLEQDIMPVFESTTAKRLPSIHYSNLDDAAILSMIERGLGVSIMSRLIIQGITANIKTLPLDPERSRLIGIIFREKNRSDRNVRNFTNCTIKAMDKFL